MNDFINNSDIILNHLSSFPLINTVNLEKLKKSTINNPEYLIDIFKSFVEDSSELLEEMEKGYSEQHYDNYYNAVHSLKGLAGTIGFSRMFQLLKIMDAHNKEEMFDESASFLPPLNEMFLEIVSYLKSEFNV
jgi:HPt (histidine-containing phosphotransfer) domain-containing protein